MTLSNMDGKASNSQAASDTSSLHEIEPHKTCWSDRTPSIPVRQIGNRFKSPLSDDQSVTPNTTLFSPIVNGEVLSPLTEDKCRVSTRQSRDGLARGGSLVTIQHGTATDNTIQQGSDTNATSRTIASSSGSSNYTTPFAGWTGTYINQHGRHCNSFLVYHEQARGSTI